MGDRSLDDTIFLANLLRNAPFGKATDMKDPFQLDEVSTMITQEKGAAPER